MKIRHEPHSTSLVRLSLADILDIDKRPSGSCSVLALLKPVGKISVYKDGYK